MSVTGRSTLVLDGHVTLHSLALDGALTVRAAPGVRVAVKGCTVTNDVCRTRLEPQDQQTQGSMPHTARTPRPADPRQYATQGSNPKASRQGPSLVWVWSGSGLLLTRVGLGLDRAGSGAR